MRSALLLWGSVFTALGVLLGCQPEMEVLDPLEDASYTLTAHDSTTVTFPDDYAGDILVVGYIYTMCPDICPMTTANMKRVYDRLESRDDVQFVTITFDPKRDTPRRLREYRAAYTLEDTPWDFLTGDSTTINALMKRVEVRHRVVTASGEPASADTLEAYFVDHTDQVNLFDPEGRIRGEYSGSRTPPEFLVEDINTLR